MAVEQKTNSMNRMRNNTTPYKMKGSPMYRNFGIGAANKSGLSGLVPKDSPMQFAFLLPLLAKAGAAAVKVGAAVAKGAAVAGKAVVGAVTKVGGAIGKTAVKLGKGVGKTVVKAGKGVGKTVAKAGKAVKGVFKGAKGGVTKGAEGIKGGVTKATKATKQVATKATKATTKATEATTKGGMKIGEKMKINKIDPIKPGGNVANTMQPSTAGKFTPKAQSLKGKIKSFKQNTITSIQEKIQTAVGEEGGKMVTKQGLKRYGKEQLGNAAKGLAVSSLTSEGSNYQAEQRPSMAPISVGAHSNLSTGTDDIKKSSGLTYKSPFNVKPYQYNSPIDAINKKMNMFSNIKKNYSKKTKIKIKKQI